MKNKFSLVILILIIAISSLFAFRFYNEENNKPKDNKENISIVSNDLLKVHYLNVSQGDSIFIELPNKEVMLIDAGEATYSDYVINYIKDLGYTKIDYLVGTHPHLDHIGGLSEVIKSFEIGNIYFPNALSNTKAYEELLNTISEKGLKIKRALAGINILSLDDLTIDIISPTSDKYSELNNYSVVIKIVYGNNSFLFMGDAEELIEKEITSNVKSDVIKVGHHGSDTSSSKEFINKVKPSIAVISVGPNNYNHPVLDIINRYKKIGAVVKRTDIDGTIVITSDKENITLNNEELEIIEDAKNEDVSLIEFTDSVKKSENATITIKGKPNTKYSIKVKYSSGYSSSKELVDMYSNDEGIVSWTFKVSSNTNTGSYPITISDDTNSYEYIFNVVE